MLSFNQNAFPTTYTDNTAANLFHLNPSEDYQSQMQQHLLTNSLPLPMLLQDDITGLDFSNPSVQEYLINNDVLDSLAQEVALTDPSSSSSLSANLSNVNSTAELLLNTPLVVPQNSPQTTMATGLQGTALSGCNMIGTTALDVQVDQFSTLQGETTLSLGVMEHLENLEKQIAEMKRFVSAGFAKRDNVRGLDVERQRLHSRNYNFESVTEINEPFEMLLKSGGGLPSRCPVNGVELKSLGHEEMNALLDEYDLPFSPALFLHEKQLIYLRFIGANRAIMHRVVD
ncbi:hypothetical protein TWF281_009270 [Arthrobotrys megalospora]